MTKLFLRKKIAPRIANGHPWVYGNEVEKMEGEVVPGDIVDVYYSPEKYAGRGYINPQSQILVRLLTRKPEPIDEAFFIKRFYKHGSIANNWVIPKTAVWFLEKPMNYPL